MHRLTGYRGGGDGAASRDAVEDPEYLREQLECRGLRVGTVRRPLGQHRHATSARRPSLLWPLDGTPFPGQDDLRAPAGAGWWSALRREYARLRGGQELLPRRRAPTPGLHASDLPDWGSALLACLKLGASARGCWSTLRPDSKALRPCSRTKAASAACASKVASSRSRPSPRSRREPRCAGRGCCSAASFDVEATTLADRRPAGGLRQGAA